MISATLGAERLERAGEQALERLGDLGRARERAVGLVEELEPLVALALGDVGAVGEEDGQQRARAAAAARARRSETISAAASARLVLVSVTARSIANICASVAEAEPPSESEIAAPIRRRRSAALTCAAT